MEGLQQTLGSEGPSLAVDWPWTPREMSQVAEGITTLDRSKAALETSTLT